MQALIERAAGIDVSQATLVVTILVGPAHTRPRKQTRSFGTVTRELLALREWLLSEGITHVAMESTGVYWQPAYAVLEDAFDVFVANARHIKNVPGRKTDVKDSEWLADLMRHGLIAKSFVPPKPIRALRELVRYRRKLVDLRSAERNRVLKVLESANIKLAIVASDVFGVSGMLMLRALAQNSATPSEIARLARGRLLRKLGALELALESRLEDHQRFLLRLQLRRLDLIQADIEAVESRIDQALEPYHEQLCALRQIPGIEWVTAAVIVSELGTDMSVFRGPRELSAWAGVCPGNNESGGKRKPTSTRKGNVYLQTALVEAAVAAGRKNGSYFQAKYRRLCARRGKKRAAMAVAHKLLIAVYHVLLTGEYRDLGPTYLDSIHKRRTTRTLVRRLELLGFEVNLKERVA
ncbi:MAG TPA: IS110 family transposase [Anaeromyxobacteraceae bacterium]|nr:IS110 family transposase [Anaeromyxobacteraceae bacterium]